MQGEIKQRWLNFCAEAIVCDDPERFEELTAEIISILKKKQQQLATSQTHTAA